LYTLKANKKDSCPWYTQTKVLLTTLSSLTTGFDRIDDCHLLSYSLLIEKL